MADVRCPMCSKLNSPEAEVCAYCGARLKPLRLSSNEQQGAGSGKGAGSSPSDEPDWLKQLRSDAPGSPSQEDTSEAPSEKPAEAFTDDSDVPDWLARIRDRARSETGSASDLFEEEKGEEPDWMKGLQAETPADQHLDDWLSQVPSGQAAAPGPVQPSASAESSEAPVVPSDVAGTASRPMTPLDVAGEEPPDWLRGISAETSGGTAGTGSEPPAFDLGPAASTGSDDEDWISKLSAWQAGLAEDDTASASASAAAGTAQPPASGAEDEFGWLRNAGSQGEASGSGTAQGSRPFTASSEEGGIEWVEPETGSSSEKPSSGFGVTGFLSSLDKKEAQQREVGQSQTGEWNENVFSSGEQPASAAPAENLPDWLSGAQAPPEPAAPASGTSGTELPGWLQGLQGLDKELPAQPAGSEHAEEPEVPDWLRADSSSLSTLGGKPSAPSAQPFTQPPEQPDALPAAEEAPLPDWLSAAGEQPQVSGPSLEEPSEPQGEPGLAEAADLPDWLGADFAKQEETPGTSPGLPAAEAASAAEEDLPGWFAGIAKEDVEQPQPNQVTGDVEPGAEQPAHGAAQETAREAADLEGEIPDWLREFEGEGKASEEAEEAIPPLAGGENVFAASADAASSFEASSMEEGEQPFTVELPEWLGEEAEAQPAEDREPLAEPAGEELAQAELPEWVKEMRPIESILPGEGAAADVDQRVEKAGPLAGMRGVLPVEDMAAHYGKAHAYTTRLHPTEKQRNQAALFDSILTQESQPLLIPPERSTATGLLVRILVALVLLLVVAFPVVFDVGTLAAPMPGLFPAENQMFQKMNQGLQSSAPVLLAIEYQPALSGEMRLAASAVVEQLMAKNARIVLVSTVPAGPALGQQLLDDAAASYKTRTGNVYNTAEMTANLGYLPGGTISLLDFAQQPQRAAPLTLDNQPAWGANSLLKDVTRLSDFSQVIVLTDRAEVGRAWVEQVQPRLGKAPLLVVASAQAAPLLQPYLASGQIAGMTGGLLGGAIYAQLAGQKAGPQFNYLPAYQVGVLLAFLIVLVGGVVSAIMALVRHDDREGE